MSLVPSWLRTLDQSASSSSARIMGSAVCTPWPNSSRLTVTVTVPSGAMATKAPGISTGLRAAGAAAPWLCAASGNRPSAKPLAAPSLRKVRRGSSATAGVSASRASRSCSARGSSCMDVLNMVVAPSGQGARGVGHGGADAGVGTTAADVAGHGGVDVGGGGLFALGQRFEEGGGAHDLAALAVAALGHVVLHPGVAHGAAHAVISPGDGFDSGDLFALDAADGRDTGARGRAAGVQGAGAARGRAAAELGAGQAQRIAQRPEHGRGGIDVELLGATGDLQGGRGGSPGNRGSGDAGSRGRTPGKGASVVPGPRPALA